MLMRLPRMKVNLLNAKYSEILITDRHLLRSRRSREVSRPLGNDRVLLLPVNQYLGISALLIGVEIRKGQVLRLLPVKCNDVQVRAAGEVLQQDLGAVRDVDPVQVAVRPLGSLAVAVVLAPGDVPQQVETVQLMEEVQLRHVGVVAEAVLWRELDRQFRVFADPADVIGGDGEGADPFQLRPGIVDFFAGTQAIAEPGWVVCLEEAAVHVLVLFFELLLELGSPQGC